MSKKLNLSTRDRDQRAMLIRIHKVISRYLARPKCTARSMAWLDGHILRHVVSNISGKMEQILLLSKFNKADNNFNSLEKKPCIQYSSGDDKTIEVPSRWKLRPGDYVRLLNKSDQTPMYFFIFI